MCNLMNDVDPQCSLKHPPLWKRKHNHFSNTFQWAIRKTPPWCIEAFYQWKQSKFWSCVYSLWVWWNFGGFNFCPLFIPSALEDILDHGGHSKTVLHSYGTYCSKFSVILFMFILPFPFMWFIQKLVTLSGWYVCMNLPKGMSICLEH